MDAMSTLDPDRNSVSLPAGDATGGDGLRDVSHR
jgi:hypothetical protein